MERKIESRWSNSFIRSGPGFSDFWESYLRTQSRDILLIMGMGFDPRTNMAAKEIFRLGGSGSRQCLALKYRKNETEEYDLYEERTVSNRESLETFLGSIGLGLPSYHEVIMRSHDNKSIASRSALKVINNFDDLSPYSDIIVDISAMPRGVYFPLINKILSLIDTNAEGKMNLHVAVAENYVLDSIIKDNGLGEEASEMQGFGGMNLETTKEYQRVWIPILGEGKENQLDIIRKYIDPAETCPLLPFPSLDPRRSDNLIKEYHKLLFTSLAIEGKNIIYADEQNPFQVYRKLLATISRYDESLSILKGCKVYISALSSKLLSVGAILAAYEMRKLGKFVGIVHVEAQSHVIDEEPAEVQHICENSQLFEIWVTGEPYQK